MALACPVSSAAPQSRAVLSFILSAKTTSESGGLRDQSDRVDRFSSISEPSLADSNVCISFDRITAYGTIGALVLLCCQLLKLKLYEPGRCLKPITKMALACPVFSATSQSREVLSLLSSAKTTSESGGLRDQSDRADRFSSIFEPSLADSNVLHQLRSNRRLWHDRGARVTMLLATQAKALRTRPLFTANDKNGSGVSGSLCDIPISLGDLLFAVFR
jgi:hypothetical protein